MPDRLDPSPRTRRLTPWLCAALAAISLDAAAQAISTADMEVITVRQSETAASWFCEVIVRNSGDDTARHPRLLVLVPDHVSDIRTSTACTPSPPTGVRGFRSHTVCALPDMNPGISTKVRVKTARPVDLKDAYARTCSAFVWSDQGDHQRGNNFETSAP